MNLRRHATPWILPLAAFGLLALTTGCVSTNPGAMEFATSSNRNKQLGMTALMALDTAQTVTIARNSDCLMEANPIAAAIYGSDAPTQKQVLLTNAVYIASHWALGSYLDRKINAPVDFKVDAATDMDRRKGWRIVRGLYQALTFLGHGAAVLTNAERGINPASNYSCGGVQ